MVEVQIYIKELYTYTPWTDRITSTATSNPGKEVVRTPHGAVTGMPSGKRIIVADLSRRLQVLITTGLPPWDPSEDMLKKYHRGRIPVHIASLLQSRGTSPLFAGKRGPPVEELEVSVAKLLTIHKPARHSEPQQIAAWIKDAETLQKNLVKHVQPLYHEKTKKYI